MDREATAGCCPWKMLPGCPFKAGDRVNIFRSYPEDWWNRRGKVISVGKHPQETHVFLIRIHFDSPNAYWGEIANVAADRVEMVTALDQLAEI